MDYPGEKLVVRLWETVAEKGIGSLLKPWQIRREGRAQIDVRREELLALAQAERDAEEIRSGRKSLEHKRVSILQGPVSNESLKEPEEQHLDAGKAQELGLIATNIALADIIRREVNVARALLHAEAELKDDFQEPSSQRINEDWLFRWRDYAGSVSVEELQTIWGRLLAGELKSPGIFSYRTLEFLHNLSQEEASQISLMFRFVINDMIFGNIGILEGEGITFSFLLAMQELGVITGVETGLITEMKSTEKDRFVRTLISNGRVLVITDKDPNRKLKVKCFKLTLIGKQILKLGHFIPSETYLRRVGQEFLKIGYKADLASYRYMNDTMIELLDSEALTANSAPQEKEKNK